MWPWRYCVFLPRETAASCLQSDSLRNKAIPVQEKETNLSARSAGRVSCIQGTKNNKTTTITTITKKQLLISVKIQWDNMRQHLEVKSTFYFYVQTSQGPIPQDISNPNPEPERKLASPFNCFDGMQSACTDTISWGKGNSESTCKLIRGAFTTNGRNNSQFSSTPNKKAF